MHRVEPAGGSGRCTRLTKSVGSCPSKRTLRSPRGNGPGRRASSPTRTSSRGHRSSASLVERPVGSSGSGLVSSSIAGGGDRLGLSLELAFELVYGSLDELERDFGERPTDLHRPAIDELTRPNPDDPTGRSTMRRTSDVLDCWFESGSMPFAQVHYPVENVKRFDGHFPADFIVEYIGQTRGWFYTMHVLSTALFDLPPFENCIAHGIIQGDDGRKMSKHLGNYPDPDMVFARWGADAMRWFLLSSSILRGQDLIVHVARLRRRGAPRAQPDLEHVVLPVAIRERRRDPRNPRTDAEGVLDRYMLAKTAALVADVTAHMDGYDLYGACSDIVSYLDALTNWYVRRSRDRFWRARDGSPEAESDKRDAYDTLSTALSTLCRVAAPFLPMLAESVYQGLTGERSVHLADWPSPDELPPDPRLVAEMELVREVCSAGHAIRKASNKRLRLPLSTLMVAGPRAHELRGYVDLIADEVNVKEVVLTDDVTGVADEVLTVVPSAIGPRLGEQTQKVIVAVKQCEWSRRDDGTVEAAGAVLGEDEYTLLLAARPDASRALPDRAGVVRLDLETTEALEREGRAATWCVSFSLRGATRGCTYLTESTWSFPCPNRWRRRRKCTVRVDHGADLGRRSDDHGLRLGRDQPRSCGRPASRSASRPCLTVTAAPDAQRAEGTEPNGELADDPAPGLARLPS